MAEKYTLILTQEQAHIVERACEIYARLGIGQFNRITEEFFEYGKFDSEQRDRANEALKLAANLTFGTNQYGCPNVEKDVYHSRAWNVYQVMRYTRAWHEQPEGNMWSVAFDKPYSEVDEPLPVCRISEENKSES